jgi:hypothetical protein
LTWAQAAPDAKVSSSAAFANFIVISLLILRFGAQAPAEGCHRLVYGGLGAVKRWIDYFGIGIATALPAPRGRRKTCHHCNASGKPLQAQNRHPRSGLRSFLKRNRVHAVA